MKILVDEEVVKQALGVLEAAWVGEETNMDEYQAAITALRAAFAEAKKREQKPDTADQTFTLGDYVRKKSGSEWEGVVVGWYSTTLTPEGYAVESSSHKGSVQIYPVGALEKVK